MATEPKPKSKTAKATKTTAGSRPGKLKRGDRIIELLQRTEGVSVEELRAEFGTKPHTIRAQISIETRKRGIKAVLDGGRYKVAATKD